MSALWPVVLRSLRARPLRAILTAAAVALGVAVILGVQITTTALDQEARHAAELRSGGSALDVRTSAALGLTDAELARLRVVPGVAAVAPLDEKRVTARADIADQGVQATVVGIDGNGTSALRPVLLRSGRMPRAGSHSEVVLDGGLAGVLTREGAKPPLRPGDKLLLTTATGPDQFTVVGLSDGTSGGAQFTNSAVFVTEAAARSTFATGLHTPLAALRLSPGSSSATVANAIHRLDGQLTAQSPRADLEQPLQQLAPTLVLITALSVVIGAGVTANSVGLSVLERRREIGLLRAAGAGSSQVFRLFAVEGLLSAVTGAVVGIGVGIALGALLVRAQSGGAVGLPVSEIHVDPLITAVIVAVGIGAALVGGAIPALGAARLSPLAAIRPAPGAGRERIPLTLTVMAPLLALLALPLLLASSGGLVALGAALMLAAVGSILPVLIGPLMTAAGWILTPVLGQSRLAATNLIRRRNRTALTSLGLVISVAAAVSVSTLAAGALTASDSWIGHVLVGDAVVHSAVPQRAQLADAFSAARGVQQVSPIRYFSEAVGSQPVQFAAIDPALYVRHNGLIVDEADRNQAFSLLSSGPNVLVPRQLADPAHWHLGSRLIATNSAGSTVRLTVAGVVEHSLTGAGGEEAILIAQPVARTNFGEDAAGFNDLQVVIDHDQLPGLQEVASRYGMQATSVTEIETSSRSALQQVIGLLVALATITVAIAMLAVVNTLLVNVRQSTRELSLLRAVGMARNRALQLVLVEAALLAGVGAVVGVATGCLLALPMLRVSSDPGFSPSFVFPLVTAIAIVGTVVGGAVLATLVPARRAAGASIVSGIRYE